MVTTMNTPTYKKRGLYLTLIILCFFLGSCLFLLNMASTKKETNLVVCIYQNGLLIQSIPLYTVSETLSFSITDNEGHYNVVQVTPTSVGIVEADCPDKTCIHMGFLTSSLFPITCLPNKLVIRLEAPADNALDGVAY